MRKRMRGKIKRKRGKTRGRMMDRREKLQEEEGNDTEAGVNDLGKRQTGGGTI